MFEKLFIDVCKAMVIKEKKSKLLLPQEPEFRDKNAWACQINPDQTAPLLSGSAMPCCLLVHLAVIAKHKNFRLP